MADGKTYSASSTPTRKKRPLRAREKEEGRRKKGGSPAGRAGGVGRRCGWKPHLPVPEITENIGFSLVFHAPSRARRPRADRVPMDGTILYNRWETGPRTPSAMESNKVFGMETEWSTFPSVCGAFGERALPAATAILQPRETRMPWPSGAVKAPGGDGAFAEFEMRCEESGVPLPRVNQGTQQSRRKGDGCTNRRCARATGRGRHSRRLRRGRGRRGRGGSRPGAACRGCADRPSRGRRRR